MLKDVLKREYYRPLPEKMLEWCATRYANIQSNICNTDAINGYGYRISGWIEIKLPYKKCNRCGYHSLWAPDDSRSHCMRHTLERGWDTVFYWDRESHVSLDDAFDRFLSQQPEDSETEKPYVLHKYFGRRID